MTDPTTTTERLGTLDETGNGCLATLWADDPGAVPHETWGSVHPAYVERFGPEAATIGPPDEALRDA
jgi:hypothetical protein